MFEKTTWLARLTAYDWFLAIAGLTGMITVLYSTSLYGVGLENDSVSYVSTARSLMSGEGFMIFDGTPYAAWPPLLPLLLAFFGTLGIEPVTTGRFLNALCHGLTIFFAGRLMIRVTSSKMLAVLGTAAVLTSWALNSVTIEIITEPMFCLLVVLFLWKVQSLSDKYGIGSIMVLASLAALACLFRYMGVTIILTGSLLILWTGYRKSPYTALRNTFIFGLVSSLPIALWMIRNYFQTSTLAGVRPGSELTLWDHLQTTFQFVTGWFVPVRVGSDLRVLLFIGVLCVALLLFWLGQRNSATDASNSRPRLLGVLILFVVVYIITLVSVFSLSVDIPTINNRFLSPLAVPVMVLIIALLSGVMTQLDRLLPRLKLIKYGVAGMFALWMIYPAAVLFEEVTLMANNGAYGYITTHWHTSKLIEILKADPPPGDIYSNCPQAVYILADLPAKLSPYRIKGFAGREEVAPPTAGNYLVWFKPGVHWSPENVRMNALETPEEMSLHWDMQIVTEASDGTIWLLRTVK